MPEPLAYRAYRFFWHSLDWFYPPNCAGCGRTGTLWCDDCDQKVAAISYPVCKICGVPQTRDQVCSNCKEYMPYFNSLRSWAIYKSEIREAIHQLKYQRNVALGQVLAIPIIDQLIKYKWPIDMVIPVPLGLARLKERGYNQASLLARPVALYFRWPFEMTAISRWRETRSQVDLSSFESRRENVAGAFTANQSKVKGKKILMIDDVTTSGATMNACAKALCEAGASDVYGITLARAGLVDLPGSRYISDHQ